MIVNPELPNDTANPWYWETHEFYIPHQIDWALTHRQDRFTWVQFLALALKNDPCLWEMNVANGRVFCAVCRVSYPAFRDALKRARVTAMGTYFDVVMMGKRIRDDRPKEGRGWALPRPWGPPLEQSTGHNWHAVVHEVWNAAGRAGRLNEPLARVRAAAAQPNMLRTTDVAEMANRNSIADRHGHHHSRGGTPGSGDDDWELEEYPQWQ